jgi:hypothetical protein
MRARSMRSGASLALVVAVRLGLATAASAQETVLKGETADGVAVKLTVGEFGNATQFKISRSKVECSTGTLRQGGITFRRLDTSDPGAFKDRSTFQSKDGALRFKTETRLKGAIANNNRRWGGEYKATTTVFQNGVKVDTCRVDTTWRVS